MSDPRQYHFKLPRYQGPRLPEPPHAWYPEVQLHSPRCTSERTARGDGRVRAFVIHATAGNSSAGAMSVMTEHSASWHWLVPDENEAEHGNLVWACAPERRAAWHVRNNASHPDVQGGARLVNYWSLGAEIVNSQEHDPFSDWQVEQIADLVRYAWSKYPDLVDVVSHAKLDPQRRKDPGPEFPWERFQSLVLAPVPTIVAVHVAGAAAAARAHGEATALDRAEPAPQPLSLGEPLVKLFGADGQPIEADARFLDGAAMAEVGPLAESLGYDVSYQRESDRRMVVRLAATSRPEQGDAAPAPAGMADIAASAAARRDGARKAAATQVPILVSRSGKPARKLDAVKDTLDFRDQMFVPTLVEVPPRRTLDEYRAAGVPILDQQSEGACTGFGLATVANYLLRTRRSAPDEVQVSPRMFYEIAKKFDEWDGVDYEGSSARGAMKGWHKHGVCSLDVWPYTIGSVDRDLTPVRSADATGRPLGAYFRVNHHDLVAMHAAIAEAGILFATGTVHDGWDSVTAEGRIPFESGAKPTGGHAFAIVAYDENGFWIQNSWGDAWGLHGFAQIGYDDWLVNGTDVWVARLGAPVQLGARIGTTRGMAAAAGASRAYAFDDLRPHVVSVGNDGQLSTRGTFGTSRADVERLLREDFTRLTRDWAPDRPKRVLLYAHGGLVPEDAALQRVAEYRERLMQEQVYPISFVWKTDYWTTITNILEDAKRRRLPDTGIVEGVRDFMYDRMDDMLEPLARALTGHVVWQEMKQNALAFGTPTGGGPLVADLLAELDRREREQGRPGIELHLVGHSAGSIFLAPLVPLLSGAAPDGRALHLETVTLWAPACTVALFDGTYRPAITGNRIGRFALYTLTDQAEQADNCAALYHKSLLYLVSNALDEHPRAPFHAGTPLLGMECHIRANQGLLNLLQSGSCEWIRSPNDRYVTPNGTEVTTLDAATARHHGDFDDDGPTVGSTLARILGRRGGEQLRMPVPAFERTRAGLRDWRKALARQV